MPNWWDNMQTGFGDALIGVNNPFGLAPPDGYDRNAAMRQGALSLGMSVLANGSDNPAVALGRGYRQAQALASDNQQNALAAQAMMSAAEEKKQKRQEEQAAKAEREALLKTLPPDVQMKARSIPGYLDSYIEATDPALQSPMNPGDRYKAVGGNIYDVETGQWITSPNGGQGDLPKGYRWKEDGSGAEAIPGVTVPGTPKPYVPGPGDRTAIRNANEENAMLEQTLVNLDEASGLVGTPDTNWKPAAGQTEADRPILPNSNSGYFSTFRGKIAENVSDGWVPDAMFGSPKQGANTMRLKQIMDAEALASMGKLLKGPTSDRDVRIMLETVNDPDASPKRKQQSIDQVKRLIRAQIAANQDTVEFSTNGPSAGGSQPVGSVDGYTIELVPEE